MTNQPMHGRIDTLSREIPASPHALYEAFMEPTALVKWMPPAGMTGEINYFNPQVDGGYSLTLTYEDAVTAPGKTTADTDTVETIFVELIQDKKIAGSSVFETEDPAVLGEMLMTWYFEAIETGTKLTVIVENVPPGIAKAAHIEGLNSTLDNLRDYIKNR